MANPDKTAFEPKIGTFSEKSCKAQSISGCCKCKGYYTVYFLPVSTTILERNRPSLPETKEKSAPPKALVDKWCSILYNSTK
jgi:hypothetical protein